MCASSRPVSTWANRQALLAEVVEDVAVHERRPALACPVGADAVVVDVPVRLLGHEPEADEAEHVSVVFEHPEPVRVLVVQPPLLLRLPLLPGQLGLEPHRVVALVAEHRDVALEDRPVTLDRQHVDGVEVAFAGMPEDDRLLLGHELHARKLARSKLARCRSTPSAPWPSSASCRS
jgi:hypothetical protein